MCKLCWIQETQSKKLHSAREKERAPYSQKAPKKVTQKPVNLTPAHVCNIDIEIHPSMTIVLEIIIPEI